MARVFVAMSGGVDSSVAAALLLEQGHEVTGVTMQLWPSSDEAGGCCSIEAVRDARRVCDLLGIAHYALNYREVFEREVVRRFAAGYAAGATPNPCVSCNDRVKFADLLAKVLAQEAEFLATGHYARLLTHGGGARSLARGVDADKDQSYFLYRLTDTQMSHVLFPLGALHKTEVRAFAERLGLPVARKRESQDICFAAEGDYASVVAQRAPDAVRAGDIVDDEGRVVGCHQGLAHYTIGQRKGLGIGGSAEPLYVVRLDAQSNRVVVGRREKLSIQHVQATDVVWHGEEYEQLTVAVRYRMEPVPAAVTFRGGRLAAALELPIDGVAPGQSLVCYRGDVVVGGGIIECAS